MATARTGMYGTYYGSTFNSSETLTQSEMEVNAVYAYSFFIAHGWSLNAIAGILGNMQAESSINPGRWQGDNVGNYSGGYGLVQWTPATNYTDWCSSYGAIDPSDMDNNLSRIMYELDEGLQWIPTSTYPMSFKEFTTSSLLPSELASVFLKNYERAGVEVEETRRNNANNWYTFLGGVLPNDPVEPDNKKKKKGFNWVLFNARRRNYGKR